MTKTLLMTLNFFWALITVPLVFIGLVTPPTILALPLPLRHRLRIVGPFWNIFARWVVKGACWSPVYAEDHRQPELKTFPPTGLYISNHQSYVDIPLMLSQYQVLPIMKKEVLYIPVLGAMGWAAGALVVSRGKRDSRKKVFIKARERLVDDKFSLQYYPEGTRSKDGKPKDFSHIKATLIQLAFESNVPVIPISMYGTSKVLNKWGVIKPGQPLGIITHKALLPKDYSSANEFAHACWAQVLKGYSELEQRIGVRPQS